MYSATCKTSYSHFPTPLVGRRSELSWLKERLQDPEVRIVSVTGSVGVGKSSLALTAMEKTRDHFPGGVRIADFDEICPELDELGLAQKIEVGTSREEVKEVLEGQLSPVCDMPPGGIQDKRVLLVLEGCEGILHHIRRILPPLLAARPNSKVLITAPMPVSAYGEDTLRLNPLPLPRVEDMADKWTVEQQPAAQLFVRRAKSARADFQLTSENCDAVTRICRNSGGNPLAIEMAASKMKIKTAHAVAQETEKNLVAFNACQGDVLSRHSSILEALGWLIGFTRPGDQDVIQQISVFQSGVDLLTVSAIFSISTMEAEERLTRLVDVGLLRTEDSYGQILFRLEELHSRFIWEQMTEDNMYRARKIHADYLMREAETLQKSVSQGDYSGLLCMGYYWSADVCSAMTFFLEIGDRESALRLAIILGRHGFSRTDQVIPVLRAGLNEGLPAKLTPEAELSLGRLLAMLGDYDEAHDLVECAEKWGKEHSDRDLAAIALRLLGTIALGRGKTTEAETLLRKAENQLADNGDKHERLIALRDLAECLLSQGTHEAAKNAAMAARDVAEQIGCKVSSSIAECVFSSVLFNEDGKLDKTVIGLRSAVRNFFNEDFVPELLPALERLSLLLMVSSGKDLALVRQVVVIIAGTAAHRKRLETIGTGPLSAQVKETLSRAHELLGPRLFIECWSTGQFLDLQGTVARALAASDFAEERVQVPCESSAMRPSTVIDPSGSTPINPLSAREMQVAELVSHGETNQVIAKRLGISKWTAINHMRKIMSKLELSSRTEVAIWFEKVTKRRIVTTNI